MSKAKLTEGQIRYRKYKKSYEAYRKKNKVRFATVMVGWRKIAKKIGLLEKYKDTERFGGIRIEALERDGYKCVKCGMTNEEHLEKWGRSITVHHKDNKGRYSKEKNNKLDNLVTLCLRCHGREDAFNPKHDDH